MKHYCKIITHYYLFQSLSKQRQTDKRSTQKENVSTKCCSKDSLQQSNSVVLSFWMQNTNSKKYNATSIVSLKVFWAFECRKSVGLSIWVQKSVVLSIQVHKKLLKMMRKCCVCIELRLACLIIGVIRLFLWLIILLAGFYTAINVFSPGLLHVC